MKQFTIKLTFYNPKELWKEFWNWAFWPRRKTCADWINYAEGVIESDMADIFMEHKISGIIMTDKDADELYNKLLIMIKEHLEKTKELMSKPL